MEQQQQQSARERMRRAMEEFRVLSSGAPTPVPTPPPSIVDASAPSDREPSAPTAPAVSHSNRQLIQELDKVLARDRGERDHNHTRQHLLACVQNISPQEKDALVVDLLLQMDQYRSQRSEAAALGKRMAQQLVRQQQDMKAQHVAEIKRLEQEVHRLTHSHPEVTQLKRQVSMLEAAHADTDKKLQFAVQKLHRSRKREKELRMMNDPLWDL